MRIHSPMVTGSGAIAVHRQLAENLDDYFVTPYSPWLQYFPLSFCGLRERRATIVHSTPDQGAFPVASEQRFVVTFHNFILDSVMQKYSSRVQRFHYQMDLSWLTRHAIRRADVITSVSQFTADMVSEWLGGERQIRIIPNGIDTDLFKPANAAVTRERVKVLVCGNASMRKGTQWLNDVARALPPDVEVNCTLTEKQLAAWGLAAGNINALGKLAPEDMPSLYRAHDILFMPTAREGFGLAVAEAMASGIPVVASDNSTMPELIEHGEGGYLCRTGAIGEYADAIRVLASNIGLRHRMGEFNRKRVQARYRLDDMVNTYRRLFAELAE